MVVTDVINVLFRCGAISKRGYAVTFWKTSSNAR